MKKSDIIQQNILACFSKNSLLSLSNIREIYTQKSEKPLTRITLIRHLKTLTEKGLLEKTGNGRAVKYQLKIAYSLLETVDTKKYFTEPSYKRNAKTAFGFEVFSLLQNNIFLPHEEKKLASLHQKFQEKFARFTTPTSVKKEFERVVIEFAWKSSSIEGNTYTLLETERLIKEHTATPGKTPLETQMIINHKIAFDYILQNTKDFVSLSRFTLESIHSLLIENLGIEKNIRHTPVGITGTEYKPLDNRFQIEEALEKMFLLLSQKTSFFEKSLLVLLLLSYIQAFEDGNKRTARTFSNAVLLAHNTCPISFKTVDEVEYKKATLLFYEQNNISYMKQIFLEQFEYSVSSYF